MAAGRNSLELCGVPVVIRLQSMVITPPANANCVHHHLPARILSSHHGLAWVICSRCQVCSATSIATIGMTITTITTFVAPFALALRSLSGESYSAVDVLLTCIRVAIAGPVCGWAGGFC